jgi:hypothetical protein
LHEDRDMTGRQILFAVLVAARCAAQVNTGSLIGTVTDQSGAAVTDAAVGIRNINTASMESHLTNTEGIYRAPFLRPGIYSVRVEAKGFRASETEVVILIGKETALNVGLEVGLVTESVTVDTAAPLVESTTAQASVNFDAKKVVALPRLIAGIDRLALLAPGVAPTQPTTTTNGATLAVNGQRRRANNFLIDGQDNNHAGFAGPSFPFNNVDAIAEYQVITNQTSAEYGKSQGAVVNITTRSGTNRLGGTATWLHQNDANLSTLTNRQRAAGLQQPPNAIDNLFGATLGGPIRRDKAFFSAYFNRQILRRDTRVDGAPSPQWSPTSAGLRALEQAFPQSDSVKALLRHGPMARSEGNPQFVLGVQRVDTLRGAAGQPVAVEMGRLVRLLPRPVDSWDFGTREDFVPSPKDRVSARFYYRDRFAARDLSIGQPTGYSTDNYTEYHNAGAAWTRFIGAGTANELRFGYAREKVVWLGADGTSFSEIGRNIANFMLPTGYLGFGVPVNFPMDAGSRSFEVQNNLTKQAGRHGLKLGGQYTRVKARVGSRRLYNGQFTFNTMQAFADNQPTSFLGAAGDLVANLTVAVGGVYFQDDYRVKPNLTLNLGIRYESATQPPMSLGDLTTQRETNPATAIWDTALPLSVRTVPVPPVDRNNWAPRIGLAYTPRFAERLFGKEATVIRGGYSIGYEFPYAFQAIGAFSSAPAGKRYTKLNFPVPADVTGDNLRRLAEPPRGEDPRQQAQQQFAPDFHSPYAQTWSLGIERRIGASQAFEARYAGSRGLSLFQTRSGNPGAQAFVANGFANVLPPGIAPGANGRVDTSFAEVALLANTASSIYHSLQMRYDGRIGGQLVLGGSYTWSRVMDNVSDLLAQSPGAPLVQFMAQNPFDLTRGERGPSDFDQTHVAALHFVWDVPWSKAQRGLRGTLLGGWTLSGMQRWNTGRPVSAYQMNSGMPTVNDTRFNGQFLMIGDTLRAFSANPSAPPSSLARVLPNGSMVDHFNSARSVTPNDVRWIYNNLDAARLLGKPFGSGRNVLRAPGFSQADLALYKNFKLWERFTAQLRFESTNSFNHPNLGPGGFYVDQAGFMNPSATEAEPRRFAAGVRILF